MAKCTHINKHSRDTKGVLDDLVCEKEDGHDGNHGAYHLQLVQKHSGIVLIKGKHYAEEKVWVEWTNDAGVLASEIVPQVMKKTQTELDRAALIKSLAGGDLPAGTIVG